MALLNEAVKSGLMASSYVGGLSGDTCKRRSGYDRSSNERCTFSQQVEAMTSVCSVGLDMIAVPEVADEIISAIIADEIAIGVINNKTTAVRIIPAIGKKEGTL